MHTYERCTPMKDARLRETCLWDCFCEKHAYERPAYVAPSIIFSHDPAPSIVIFISFVQFPKTSSGLSTVLHLLYEDDAEADSLPSSPKCSKGYSSPFGGWRNCLR